MKQVQNNSLNHNNVILDKKLDYGDSDFSQYGNFEDFIKELLGRLERPSTIEEEKLEALRQQLNDDDIDAELEALRHQLNNDDIEEKKPEPIQKFLIYIKSFSKKYFRYSEQSSNSLFFATKLPKWTHRVLNEETQAFLIDYRQHWYANQVLNWRIHIIVELKTYYFIFIEVFWNQSIAKIKNLFQPLHKPRLPRK